MMFVRGRFALEGNYGIYLDKELIGKAQVLRKGLYYQIYCRCRLSGDTFYQMLVSCGEKQENLGTVVPADCGFGLETKIPVKRLGEGAFAFSLISKTEGGKGKFTPIYPDEPFAYLAQLKNAYLVRRNGVVGVMI